MKRNRKTMTSGFMVIPFALHCEEYIPFHGLVLNVFLVYLYKIFSSLYTKVNYEITI